MDVFFFFFKQKTAYEMRISDWSSDVCSSDLPFRQVEFDIMYGEGISKIGEILDLGVKANIVEKSGAWFSYDSQRIGQGRENAKTFLKANPELLAKLETTIRANASGVSEEPMAGPDHTSEDDEP